MITHTFFSPHVNAGAFRCYVANSSLRRKCSVTDSDGAGKPITTSFVLRSLRARAIALVRFQSASESKVFENIVYLDCMRDAGKYARVLIINTDVPDHEPTFPAEADNHYSYTYLLVIPGISLIDMQKTLVEINDGEYKIYFP